MKKFICALLPVLAAILSYFGFLYNSNDSVDFITSFKKNHTTVIVPNLGEFYLPDEEDYVQSYLRSGKVWEPVHQSIFQKYIKPGDTVVDAGAYIGSHTVKLAQLASPGKVYAFEPQRDIFDVLNANIKLNQLSNVKAYRFALGDQDCFVDIKVNPKNKGASPASLCSSKNVETGFQLRTLDSFHLGKVSFMKIDVEGYEELLLRGAQEIINKYKPVMVIEVGVNKQKHFLPYLKSLGYEFTEFVHQEFLATPVPGN